MKYTISLLANLMLLGHASAQTDPPPSPEPELNQQLETDAASVLSRGLYIKLAQHVCTRGSPEAAQALEQARLAWEERNRAYLRASAAAINDMANWRTSGGSDAQKNLYRHNVARSVITHASNELKRDFNGATPDNEALPPVERCRQLADGLNQGRVDFSNTPGAINSLRKYMNERPPATSSPDKP